MLKISKNIAQDGQCDQKLCLRFESTHLEFKTDCVRDWETA